MFNCFVTFPCGILGQVWYLIVSIQDLCYLFLLSIAIKTSTFDSLGWKLYFSVDSKFKPTILVERTVSEIRFTPVLIIFAFSVSACHIIECIYAHALINQTVTLTNMEKTGFFCIFTTMIKHIENKNILKGHRAL